MTTVLVFLLLLAASVWVGGIVVTLIVKQVVDRRLDAVAAVAFFRDFGRRFGVVGGVALVVALATGGALLTDRGWDALAVVAIVLAAAVVVVTGVGVRQARAIGTLRDRALRVPDDRRLADELRRAARRASGLRATIGLLTLALVALGAGISVT